MTDSPKDLLDIASPLSAAASRLDAALAHLESGMQALAARAAAPSEAPAGDGGAREAELEAALREASDTLGAMIGEVRAAIVDAEAEAGKVGGAEGAGLPADVLGDGHG